MMEIVNRLDDLDLGFLCAVTSACVWSPRPLTTWLEALGSVRAIVDFASSNASVAPPPGAEALSADALERLRAVDADAARRALDDLRASGCQVVLCDDAAYPKRLRDLRDPPLVLYYRGDLRALDRRAVAIVGSRGASSYGRTQAAQMAAELCGFGACVVSGFARGIDAAAHRGALDAGGLTAAVPGSGLSALYPDYHERLAAEIVERGGLVMSEFAPAMPARPHHFPMRNRIVAALADATVIIEANQRSGALITARLADELGRHVFALPGDVDRPTSAGTNGLIKDGVILVTSGADVASLLQWDRLFPNVNSGAAGSAPADEPVVNLLRAGVDDADEIAARLGMSAASVGAQLTLLEIQGIVVRKPGGKFAAAGTRASANDARA